MLDDMHKSPAYFTGAICCREVKGQSSAKSFAELLSLFTEEKAGGGPSVRLRPKYWYVLKLKNKEIAGGRGVRVHNRFRPREPKVTAFDVQAGPPSLRGRSGTPRGCWVVGPAASSRTSPVVAGKPPGPALVDERR